MSDTPPQLGANEEKFRPFAEILFSLSFLTRLPIPLTRTLDPPALSQSMRFFPVAGALIGVVTALVLVALHWLQLPPFVAAILTCMFALMLTGGLHEDGLADSSDGLFGGKSKLDRLAIMRDSRIGSYGTMALILSLLLRIVLLDALALFPPLLAVSILAAACAFSRAMMVDLMWATKAARSDGLSVYAGRPGRNSALFAIFCGGALVLMAGFNVRPESGVYAVLAATAVTGLIRRFSIKQIGGQTGDICGATQVLTELTILIIFVAMLH